MPTGGRQGTPTGGAAGTGEIDAAAPDASGGSGGRTDASPTRRRSYLHALELYGRSGELWKPDGRLIFAGYAGYHTGSRSDPDGGRSDEKASPSSGPRATTWPTTPTPSSPPSPATEGVLLIPAGRYIITKQIDIKKSNFVLRGEGARQDRAVLPEAALRGQHRQHLLVLQRRLHHGVGRDNGEVIGNVTANAGRGAQQLTVSATTGVAVGGWVRIVQTDKGGSLFRRSTAACTRATCPRTAARRSSTSTPG
jgi:hypothetical protein